ncbi:hypothetical protein PSA7680_01950 [Pseudoruegeria aquimaris]|uniref:Arginine transporter n=1 Tax=Pseudoruegeria aquimaris TaxID=393663 RepID=A0A1Y5SK43_9RHOB|nr:hypothetical protein [Pseudoruegeria aquimaris]SLN39534.1 hypothetical protein PSA7680_01950 [Pseudoruegeria aquimaris]
MKPIALAALVLALTTPTLHAGTIERACLKSDRKGASRALCGCIQDVADLTLTRKDQKLAASFFKDPHRAQEIRQSDNSGHEKFWQRYKSFGATAESYCRRS